MANNILCVIPARSGSSRVPEKNLAKIGGKTLVELAYETAVSSQIFNTIVVSTDSERFACGLPWVRRPDHMSGESADIADATSHALIECEIRYDLEYDYVVTLQPAIPIRTAKMIKRLLHRVIANRCGGGVTGIEVVPWLWSQSDGRAKNGWYPDSYPRSQEFKGTNFWQEVNAVQISRRDSVIRGDRWGLPLAIELLPSYAALDIDEPADLERAQLVYPHLIKALSLDKYCKGFVISSINDSGLA